MMGLKSNFNWKVGAVFGFILYITMVAITSKLLIVGIGDLAPTAIGINLNAEETLKQDSTVNSVFSFMALGELNNMINDIPIRPGFEMHSNPFIVYLSLT